LVIFNGNQTKGIMQTTEQREAAWIGTCHNLFSLDEMIGALPETIQGINVPVSLDHFNPARREVKPSGDTWRQAIKDMVRATLDLPGGREIDQFSIRSYNGGAGLDASYYMQISSPASRDFARRMSAGEFGRLD
jgi:hypothetical protein